MADPAFVRRYYDWAGEFRRALDAPDILQNDRFWQTVEQFMNRNAQEDLDAVVMVLPRNQQNAGMDVNDVYNDIDRDIHTRRQDPNDNQWKSTRLGEIKRALDALIAVDPGAPPQDAEMAGGKKRRRKTRKGKSRKASRRARYSRRR
jgi:hypothetical protein